MFTSRNMGLSGTPVMRYQGTKPWIATVLTETGAARAALPSYAPTIRAAPVPAGGYAPTINPALLPPPTSLPRLAMYGAAALGGAYLLYRLLRGSSPHGATEVRQNPARLRNPGRVPVVTRSERLKRAVATYEGFHWGDPPDRISRRKVSTAPKIGVKLGKLVAVAYETHKNGERAVWEHEFGEEGGKRPDLVMDSETEKLHIVGGSYTVSDAGIID